MGVVGSHAVVGELPRMEELGRLLQNGGETNARVQGGKQQ
jgi:hypothetical protein